MLPTDKSHGSWPTSGELDILKYAGHDKDYVYSIIHTGEHNYSTEYGLLSHYEVEGSEEDFHLYEMIWEPGYIEFLIDGERTLIYQYNPFTNPNVAIEDAWPFDVPFYLMINIGVGGWGSEEGLDYSIFPATLEIDYVRVYQKDYAATDQSDPLAVDELIQINATKSTMRLAWNEAVDDGQIEKYDVFVEDEFYGTTFVTGIDIYDLEFSTEYKIDVVAIDFAGHRSPKASNYFSTTDDKYSGERVEAEDYLEMDGIQTEATSDVGSGLNVGWIDDGDYLTYRLNLSKAGNYKVIYRVASNVNGGTIALYSDADLLNTLSFETTNGWQNWITVESEIFYLDAGLQTFKLLFTQGGCNINYFELRRVE